MKIRETIRSIWNFMLALIGVVLLVAGGTFLWSLFETSNTQSTIAKEDFSKRFVTYEQGTNDKDAIVLDINQGCLYISNSGTITSPLVKNGKFDCDKKYIAEYKNRQTKGKK